VTLRRLLPALALAAALGAHPMGNFSVNHYTRVEVSRRGVAVTYALDLAEIPTFELLREWKLDAKGPREALQARAVEQAREWVKNVEFRAGGVRVQPKFLAAELALAEGAGGLAVGRITARLELPPGRGRLELEDRNYAGRAGWKEIVIAAGEGARLVQASHGSTDRSKALTEYPAEPAIAPPQDLRATLAWRVDERETVAQRDVASSVPSAPAATQPAAGTVVKGDFLSRMLGNRGLTLGMMALGLLVAFGLGGMHALSPGHGKTIVAAYLIGTRGTAAHAAILGAMVTFTHTASVFALGLGTLFLSKYVAPEKAYPVLGAISGLSIVLIGASLFWKRMRKLTAAGHPGHPHSHDHHHEHDHHHDHGHSHGAHSHTHYIDGDVTVGSLLALGVSGGLVPCPSALVLLLSSIALGRVALGLTLLVAFSLGLAAVLMGIGILVLYAKHLLPDTDRAAQHPAFKLVPVLSAAVITMVGCVMTAVSLGWVRPGGWVN
jgi:nickel/cobalt exporter